jgi:hypothetical protein
MLILALGFILRVKRKLKRGGFPHDDMTKHAQDALFVGLLCGLGFGPTAGLASWLVAGPMVGPVVGLVGGLAVGLIGRLNAGGFACLRYFILRLWLTRNRSTPWNYVRFLDYAADRILLRKVGRGYAFIHRMLLEHFAARYVEPAVAAPKLATSSSTEPEL